MAGKQFEWHWANVPFAAMSCSQLSMVATDSDTKLVCHCFLLRREMRRAQAAREQALFENYFQQKRHRFVHLWADRSQNFLTKMGIWNAVRRKLREEMQTGLD
jgi:hypothetical protein